VIHPNLRNPSTARNALIAATESKVDPSIKPVLDVIDGRATNDDLSGDEWVTAIKAAEGDVAVYFELPADLEWWIAYDADYEPPENGYTDGAFCQWARHPGSGGWDFGRNTAGILAQAIDDMEGHDYDICRSRVVQINGAPDWLREKLAGGDRG
jgi:hypothetical protein